MGLDMYLRKVTYIGAEYKHRNVTGNVTINVDGKPLQINFNRITYINETVMYWRKANAIHQWFVDNVQGGVDDCRYAELSISKLQELLNELIAVNSNRDKAAELLPTTSGFFFGGTDYDEYYWEDVEKTITKLTEILAEDNSQAHFEYHSSW